MKISQTKSFKTSLLAPSATLTNAANGTLTSFSGTLSIANRIIVPGSVIITKSSLTITDNKNGVLSGTNVSGTINYLTGAWTLVFATAPTSGAIAIVYNYSKFSPIAVSGETGTASLQSFSNSLVQGFSTKSMIVPDSFEIELTIASSTVTFKDNSRGQLTQTSGGTLRLVSGSVDYSTGKFQLQLNTVPDNSTYSLTYSHTSENLWEDVIFDRNTVSSSGVLTLTIYSPNNTTYAVLQESSDGVVYTNTQLLLLPQLAKRSVTIFSNKSYKLVSSDNTLLEYSIA